MAEELSDEQVVVAAQEDGFELVERPCGDRWAWGFVREGPEGDRFPCGERRLVISHMRDWLRRGRMFE